MKQKMLVIGLQGAENKWLRLSFICVIANALTALLVCGLWWSKCGSWKACHDLASIAPADFFVLSALAIASLAASGLLSLGASFFLIKGIKT